MKNYLVIDKKKGTIPKIVQQNNKLEKKIIHN